MRRRDLLYDYRTPILQQHGKVWFYHFPKQRPVTVRCPQANGWTTHTASLAGVGHIFNASRCSIITNDIRTSPELHGEIQDNIDIDSLFQIRQTSSRQAQQTYWHLIATTTICEIATLNVLYFSLRSYIRNIVTCYLSANKSLEPSTSERDPSPLPPEPRRRAYSPQQEDFKKKEICCHLLHTTN